jgi:glucan biosynthesis protein C
METGNKDNATSETRSERRYELDWMRVFAVYMVWIFHNILTFRGGYWHINNNEFTIAANATEPLLAGFGMSLFSVISGMAIYYTVDYLGIQKLWSPKSSLFVKARFVRLMVPFLFGLVVFTPLVSYFEGLQKETLSGSFLDFFFQRFFLEGWESKGGWFKWWGNHLWYLIILFAWSVVALPLFIQLRTDRNRDMLSKLAGFLNRPGALYLLLVPIFIIEYLNPFTQFMIDLGPAGMRAGGWHILSYLVFMIYGYIFASNSRFEDAIERQSVTSLIIAIFLGLVLVPVWLILTAERVLNMYNAPSVVLTLMAIYGWSMIIVVFSFAKRRLSSNHKLLKFLNQIAMPFYILHYPVSIPVQYYVVALPYGIIVKFLLINIISFVIIVSLSLVVRRFNVLRFLFGLSIRPQSSQ